MMKLYDLLKEIDFERLAGSTGEKKARDIFKKHLKAWGLKSKEHKFELNSFDTGTAEVIHKKTKLKAHPLGLVKTTEVSGELCFIENSELVLCQKGTLKNKIVLTYTRSPILADRLKEEGVVAVIYITPPYKDVYCMNLRQKSFEEGAVPAVYISYNDAKILSQKCGENITVKIEQLAEKRKSYNLVVDIPGTGADRTLTCLVAHYDTVALSHGANDNAAGSVVCMKIAEHYSQHPPLRDLRIILFSGEELGLCGSFAYVNKYKDELKDKMGLCINVDVSGDDVGTDKFYALATIEILGYVDGIFKEEGLVFNKALDIYSSDCMPFSVYEIPSINLAREGGESTFFIHTKYDSYDKVTQRGLEATFNATKILCDRLLNSKIYPVKSGIDPSLRDKIEKYLFNSTREEPKLEWKKKYEK